MFFPKQIFTINAHDKFFTLSCKRWNEARTFCFCFICFIFNLLSQNSVRVGRSLQIHGISLDLFDMKKVQVDILGLSTSPQNNGAYALILHEIGGKRKLPIIIGSFEAQAIALKLENIKAPRPFTHDLVRSIAETFSITVTEVVIDELKNETFYAKVVCEMSGVVQEIDARPSDAIAIAVRCDAPIFVSDEVMNEAGIVDEKQSEQVGFVGAERKQESQVRSSTPLSKLDELNEKLSEAISKEDYEKAARIRDEISKLKNKG